VPPRISGSVGAIAAYVEGIAIERILIRQGRKNRKTTGYNVKPVARRQLRGELGYRLSEDDHFMETHLQTEDAIRAAELIFRLWREETTSEADSVRCHRRETETQITRPQVDRPHYPALPTPVRHSRNIGAIAIRRIPIVLSGIS
jgi:hypothetical protein